MTLRRECVPKSSGRSSRRWREVVRPLCFERDRARDAVCHICHQPIDYCAPPQTPSAWEPDHIKPVDKFPELAEDPANIAPSHSSCNRSRGNKEMCEKTQLGLSTENWLMF